MEVPKIGTRVPQGAPSLRKEVLPQRYGPRRCCREESEFGEPGPGGPVRRDQNDLLLVLPDLAQGLRKKAHWGKRIFATPRPAVRQCIRAERALGQGIKQGAMGRVVRGKQIYLCVPELVAIS